MFMPHINQNVLPNVMKNTEDSTITVNNVGFNLKNSIAEDSVS